MENSNEQGLLAIFPPHKAKRKKSTERILG